MEPCAVLHSIWGAESRPVFLIQRIPGQIQEYGNSHLVPSCCATMNGWSLPELPSPEKKKNASTSIFSLQLCGTEVKTGLAHGQKAQEYQFLMLFLVGGNWSQNWVVGA